MLIMRSDDGYFGLTQRLSGVFREAESSVLRLKEHCMTEDGYTVAP